MKYIIKSTEADHLAFQLFDASTNPIKVKSRKRSHIIQILFCASFVAMSILTDNDFLKYFSIVILVLEIFLGRIYIKWMHKRHYVKHVRILHKNSFDEAVEIEISDDMIYTSDKTGDNRTKISELELVNELKDQYFLKLNTGPVLVVPKTDINLNQKIKEMTDNHNIPHIDYLNWKW